MADHGVPVDVIGEIRNNEETTMMGILFTSATIHLLYYKSPLPFPERDGVAVTDFPEYVQRMQQKKKNTLAHEYEVYRILSMLNRFLLLSTGYCTSYRF